MDTKTANNMNADCTNGFYSSPVLIFSPATVFLQTLWEEVAFFFLVSVCTQCNNAQFYT